MTMFTALKDATQRAEQVHNYTDFVKAAGCIMTTRGYGEAARRAEKMGWPKVAEVLQKANVPGASTGSSGMAITGLLSAFMASVRNVGAFDTVAEQAMRFPDGFVGRASVFSNVAASTVSEGAAKPLRYLSLVQTDFTPVKTIGQIVMTREVIDALGDAGLRILSQELRNSVAVGADVAFLAALSGNSSEAMGGETWQGINDDIKDLLRDLNLGAGSRPYLIVQPALGKSIAVEAMANGIDSIAWNGGSYAGVPILVSDGQTPGRITAVDASGIAVALGEIELRSSEQATIEMVDSSSQTSATSVGQAQMVSMFQTNSRCLQAERSFSVKPIRNSSYAHLTGIQFGVGYGSPQAF